MASPIEELTATLSRVLGIPGDSAATHSDQKSLRADQLKEALAAAEKAWLDGSHDSLALVAEKVADAARDGEYRPFMFSFFVEKQVLTILVAKPHGDCPLETRGCWDSFCRPSSLPRVWSCP